MQDFLNSLVVVAAIGMTSMFVMYFFGQVTDWLAHMRHKLALRKAVVDYMVQSDMPYEVAVKNVPGGIEAHHDGLDRDLPLTAPILAQAYSLRSR